MIKKEIVRDDFLKLINPSYNKDKLTIKSITERPHSSVYEVGYSNKYYMIKYYHTGKDKAEREYILFNHTNQNLKDFDYLNVPEPVEYSVEKGILITKKIYGDFELLSHRLKMPHLVTKKFTSIIEKSGIWLKEFQNVPFPEQIQMHIYNHGCFDLEVLFKKVKKSVDNRIDMKRLFKKMKKIEADWPESQYVFCHRDFTPWNIIYTRTGNIYVVDFATTCQGDPEYDVARFLSMLRISGDFNSKKRVDNYCAAFMKGFDKDLNPKRLFYWRIVALVSWLSRVNKDHNTLKANFSRYMMLRSLLIDLQQTVNQN